VEPRWSSTEFVSPDGLVSVDTNGACLPPNAGFGARYGSATERHIWARPGCEWKPSQQDGRHLVGLTSGDNV
jgi:hypothetical protein